MNRKSFSTISLVIACIAATLIATGPSTAAPSSKCTKSQSLLAKYEKSGKKKLAAKAQKQVTKYCKTAKKPAAYKPFPATATSTTPLGARLIPYGDSQYRNTYDVYAPYRGESKALFGGANVSGQGDIEVDANSDYYSKWYAAYSIPPTCSSATATFTSRLSNHFGTRGELSGYIKATAASGQVLGSADLPRMSLANKPADGPSGSLTVPIDPVTGTVVIFETNLVENGAILGPDIVKTLSVSGNCALNIVSNRVTLNTATQSGDTVRITGLIEAQYSDGEWRPAPQGDVALINLTLFPIGENGAFSVEVPTFSWANFRKSIAYRGVASPLISCRDNRCKF